jgi:hypothetical protein
LADLLYFTQHRLCAAAILGRLFADILRRVQIGLTAPTVVQLDTGLIRVLFSARIEPSMIGGGRHAL